MDSSNNNMDTYYRNIEDIKSDEGILIESGSLWEVVNERLVLVDDDVYASHDFDDDLFEIA
jgi:hypothetical protein